MSLCVSGCYTNFGILEVAPQERGTECVAEQIVDVPAHKITVRFEERECSTYRVTCRGRNGGLLQTISNECEGDFLLDVVLEVGLTNVVSCSCTVRLEVSLFDTDSGVMFMETGHLKPSTWENSSFSPP